MDTGDILQRERLRFEHAVQTRFSFLPELGFAVTYSSATIVRYRKRAIEVAIYHGRRSYELGLEIGWDGETYRIGDIIRITDECIGSKYQNWAATTVESLEAGLDQLAELVKKYGERALSGDPEFFATLKQQRSSWAHAFALDMRARQVRPKADTAFREKRYREAADLYEEIAPSLTPAEKKKLAFARARSAH